MPCPWTTVSNVSNNITSKYWLRRVWMMVVSWNGTEWFDVSQNLTTNVAVFLLLTVFWTGWWKTCYARV
jgi:hypothetical protein